MKQAWLKLKGILRNDEANIFNFICTIKVTLKSKGI